MIFCHRISFSGNRARQFTGKGNRPMVTAGTANGDLPTLHLHIREASSKAAMPGATITLIPSPGDTLYTATNQYGYATLNPVLKQDSMTVRASYVGYQTQEHRLPARYTSRYEILLPIDSMLISAIVIQGKQIAMIQRGDTTLYNASAFKTMRGDRMGELLKQLPGVEIRGDKLYASGEEGNKLPLPDERIRELMKSV